MIVYPDSSLVVAALVEEAGSERADAWLSNHTDNLAVSGWLELEVASALAAKVRQKVIGTEQSAEALALYGQQVKAAARHLAISGHAFSRASMMIGAAPGLRAGDALHLAIAEAHGVTLFTLDVRQAKLGKDLGVSTQLL